MAASIVSLISGFNNHPELMFRTDVNSRKNIDYILGKSATKNTVIKNSFQKNI